MENLNINDFLVWLTGAGGVVAASWLLERLNWFQALDSTKRQLVFFASCLLISLSAWGVQTYVPEEILTELAPIFTIVAGSFAAIFLGTGFHKFDRSAKG